jgi:hypothetical protein
MALLDEFETLARKLTGRECPAYVDLVQVRSAWVLVEAFLEVRRALDDALLSRQLLVPGVTRIRRVVLYDLPERRAGGLPVQEHESWVNRLRRDLSCLGSTGRHEAAYQIRQSVLPREIRAPLSDMVVLDDPVDPAFHQLWTGRETFGVGPGGPYGDRDAAWYLDFDVGETDRVR